MKTPLKLLLSSLTLLLTLTIATTTTTWADGPVVKQSTCTITWTAPQTSANGSNLTDLKEYGIYIGSLPSLLGPPTAVVPAPLTDPAAGAVGNFSCSALALPAGQYYFQLDAVDTNGNRSARTAVLPFVAAQPLDVVPPSAPTAPAVTGP